ncbi:unnamed protein product [Symbiodinium natans]|uniref:Uncharacterized protein n=1 Tax=Symbiodinium natans TaxID=878477 RepID=A0A812Q679_9DINO|nr:unnamed protein product [Symbiodinium natans]
MAAKMRWRCVPGVQRSRRAAFSWARILGRCTRLVFEVCGIPCKHEKFAQVGIARVGADEADALEGVADESKLSVFTPLLDSVCFTSCGDIQATMPIEVASPGDHHLCHRTSDWWSGGPEWDLKGRALRAYLEVDLVRGDLSFRLESWTEEPIVVSCPDLLTESPRPWTPLVSISQGHEARICDLHLVCSS